MTCLQDDLCYNWNLGTSPTAAELHYEACPITVNGAPYPGHCGVVFEAPDGNTVAIRFDAFDVGSNDRTGAWRRAAMLGVIWAGVAIGAAPMIAPHPFQ